MSKKILFVLLGIFGLALFLRVYNITEIPPALSWDEVSIGYNAYSILKTGRDEHGRFLPLDTFIAYGDYKPPLPVYLTVPFVAIFGLNELSVRLPSAVAGALTVAVLFFLVKELFEEGKGERGKGKAKLTLHASRFTLTSSLLLALSPWHIMLSRAGFEANIALFWIVCGVTIALRARRQPKLLLVSWIPFVAAVYTFNSARYVGPLLGVALLTYSWNAYKFHLKELSLGLVISAILLLPITGHLVSKEARLRFHEVNIFTDLSVVETANKRIEADENAWWSKILHNRRIGYARSYLNHFLDHFEPRYLFIRGDGNPKFSIQDVGQFYLVDAPLLLIGLFALFRQFPKTSWFLIFWVVLSIAPAALARETPHALRTENGVPVWYIWIAAGFAYVLAEVNKKKLGRGVLFIILILYIGNALYFFHTYLTHYAKEYSGEWQYGYREALGAVAPYKNQYKHIVITENIGRPYMYTLFYTRFNPAEYLRDPSRDTSFDDAGFYHVYGFDTYRFVRDMPEGEGNTLYVMPPSEVPGNARILETIKLLNGTAVLVVFDV